MKSPKIIVAVISTILCLLSCSKENDIIKNEIKIDDQIFAIEKISLTESYTENGITKYILLITEEGVKTNEGEVSGGKGALLFADIYSKNTTGINSGIYNFEEGKENNPDFSLEDLEYTFEYDESKGDNVPFIEVEKGSISVTRNQNDYRLTFNLTNENGKVLTGNYNGNIQLIPKKADLLISK